MWVFSSVSFVVFPNGVQLHLVLVRVQSCEDDSVGSGDGLPRLGHRQVRRGAESEERDDRHAEHDPRALPGAGRFYIILKFFSFTWINICQLCKTRVVADRPAVRAARTSSGASSRSSAAAARWRWPCRACRLNSSPASSLRTEATSRPASECADSHRSYL